MELMYSSRVVLLFIKPLQPTIKETRVHEMGN